MHTQVRQLCHEGVPAVLVGSKADLAETITSYRAVDEAVAADRAAEEGLLFCEGSAKTGARVHEAFYLLACEVVNRRNEQMQQQEEEEEAGGSRHAPSASGGFILRAKQRRDSLRAAGEIAGEIRGACAC